jgi:hypothetical protein
VVEVLAAFEPPPSRRTVPFPRKWMAGSHEIWEYYVERPSPLFFPAQTEAWFYFISDGTFLRNLNRGFSGCVTDAPAARLSPPVWPPNNLEPLLNLAGAKSPHTLL